MAKYRVFDLIYRQGKNRKLKTQFELNNMTDSIDKIRKLETDLTYNIEETVEIGVSQSGHRIKVNSKLREKMINQKEVVENKIEFLTTEQIHLQKTVAKHELKNKKVLEKLTELKLSDQQNLELKRFDRDILMRKK
ncbi:hypothetical protein N9D61_05355 [Planktomarina sp.]|jgi:hypothetical protein|nr:hypothetical protein [Planktomarina sp.]